MTNQNQFNTRYNQLIWRNGNWKYISRFYHVTEMFIDEILQSGVMLGELLPNFHEVYS